MNFVLPQGSDRADLPECLLGTDELFHYLLYLRICKKVPKVNEINDSSQTVHLPHHIHLLSYTNTAKCCLNTSHPLRPREDQDKGFETGFA